MITKQFFLEQMNRLSRAYPSSNLYQSQDRLMAIWEIVNHLNETTLGVLVTDLLADNNFPPTRKEFREWLSNRRTSQHFQDVKQEKSDYRKRLTAEEIAAGLAKFRPKEIEYDPFGCKKNRLPLPIFKPGEFSCQ